jgi:hypothetical protein
MEHQLQNQDRGEIEDAGAIRQKSAEREALVNQAL